MMAHCVISPIFDTDINRMVPACIVHTSHAPCMRNGEAASTVPLETWDHGGRDKAIEFWHKRTHGQRPMALHHSRADDDRDHEGPGCWCGPEHFAGQELA